MVFRCVVFGLLGSVLSACIPGFLNRHKNASESTEIQTAAGATGAAAAKKGAPQLAQYAAPVKATRPSIFAVDQGTFRIQLAYDRVWDACLDVLLKNYNLSIADRTNGLITTEWDSYYLEGKVHRNKLSLRLKHLASSSVELTIFNNVEVLSKLPDGGITEIWLPTDKNKFEIGRILQNMAIAMGQSKPELPQELTAGSAAQMEKTRL